MWTSRHFGTHTEFRTGFTLIELLTVIVLIAILSGMAIPRMNTSRFRSDAAMRAVQGTLQRAQRSAIQQQTDVIVSFDTADARIRVVFDANNNHTIDPDEEVRWTSLTEGSRFATPPSGITGATDVPIKGNNLSSLDVFPTIYYRRDGSASSNYEVYIRSSSDNIADFRGLRISQATGRVDVFRYSRDRAWSKGSL